MDTLLKLSIVLLTGFIGGKAARTLHLPNVTGYLVAGLILGPSLFGLINGHDTAQFAIISELALGFIAFSIGSEFLLREIKKVGKAVFFITLAEVIGAISVVFSVTYYLFAQPFAFSLIIASMSAATAPAATIMVIKQFRARGPLTKTILPVVALDDIMGIMAFGIAMSVAKINLGITDVPLGLMISYPFIEILGSILLGFAIGLVLSFLAKRITEKEHLLPIILAVIGGTTGLAKVLNLSTLLSCIAVGTALVNAMPESERVFSAIDDFTSPVILLFFTLAGASLDLRILAQVGVLGVAYILARGAGKMLGAWVGAKAVGAQETVVKYLGLSLLPQGGISIGLSILVRQQLPQYSLAITTVIMFSVLIYEITGPIFAKIAIEKAGEIPQEEPALVLEKKEEYAY